MCPFALRAVIVYVLPLSGPQSPSVLLPITKWGSIAAIGLQLRANPAARRARDLVTSGAIGRVLNARILSTTMAFGPEVERAMAFAEQAENGVTLPAIQGAHTLDLAITVLGGFC